MCVSFYLCTLHPFTRMEIYSALYCPLLATLWLLCVHLAVYNAPFYTNDDLQQMRLAYYAITYLCLFTHLFLSISHE